VPNGDNHSRQAGAFTLFGLPAVLMALVLALVLMVAAPRYLAWTAEARETAAQGAVSQARGWCYLTCTRLLLQHPGERNRVTAAAIVGELGPNPSIDPGIKITLRAEGNLVWIAVTEVDGRRMLLESSFTVPGA